MLGGSVGLAARQRGVAGQVTGLVRRAESVGECLAAGAVDTATQDLAEALDGSALVILCTPVGDMADMAAQLSEQGANRTTVTACALIVKGLLLRSPGNTGAPPASWKQIGSS